VLQNDPYHTGTTWHNKIPDPVLFAFTGLGPGIHAGSSSRGITSMRSVVLVSYLTDFHQKPGGYRWSMTRERSAYGQQYRYNTPLDPDIIITATYFSFWFSMPENR